MKNGGKAVREAYTTALTGITYGGKSVPVYVSQPVETTPDNYIILGSINETYTGNDSKFITNVVITIDIFTRTYRYYSRDAVDTIAETITQTILPTIPAELTNSNFQIGAIKQESANYLDSMQGAVFVCRKVLQFNQQLIEQ